MTDRYSPDALLAADLRHLAQMALPRSGASLAPGLLLWIAEKPRTLDELVRLRQVADVGWTDHTDRSVLHDLDRIRWWIEFSDGYFTVTECARPVTDCLRALLHLRRESYAAQYEPAPPLPEIAELDWDYDDGQWTAEAVERPLSNAWGADSVNTDGYRIQDGDASLELWFLDSSHDGPEVLAWSSHLHELQHMAQQHYALRQQFGEHRSDAFRMQAWACFPLDLSDPQP